MQRDIILDDGVLSNHLYQKDISGRRGYSFSSSRAHLKVDPNIVSIKRLWMVRDALMVPKTKIVNEAQVNARVSETTPT